MTEKNDTRKEFTVVESLAQAEAVQLWTQVLELKKKMSTMVRKLELLKAQHDAVRASFWNEMIDRFPQLEDGDWRFEYEEMKFKPKHDDDGMPPFIKRLLDGGES